MPEKGKNPNRRKYIQSLKKLSGETDPMQGGVVESYDQSGQATVRMTNGNRLKGSTPFNLASVPVGGQVNPTTGAVPGHDFAPSASISTVPTTLQQISEIEVRGEIKVLYYYFDNPEFHFMVGGHLRDPIEILVVPGNNVPTSAVIENTGTGDNDFIVDIKFNVPGGRRIRTIYGNSSQGTTWDIFEDNTISQQELGLIAPKGSGFWSSGTPILPDIRSVDSIFTTESVIQTKLTDYTDVQQFIGPSTDPAVNFVHQKTSTGTNVLSTTSTWAFTGTNSLDYEANLVNTGWDGNDYLSANLTGFSKRELSTTVHSISAYNSSATANNGNLIYEWDITKDTIGLSFNGSTNQYDKTFTSGSVTKSERLDYSLSIALSPTISKTETLAVRPETDWDGSTSIDPGRVIVQGEVEPSGGGDIPSVLSAYLRDFSDRSDEITTFTGYLPLTIHQRGEIANWRRLEIDDIVSSSGFGAYTGVLSQVQEEFRVGSDFTEQLVKTSVISTPQHGEKDSVLEISLVDTAVETTTGIDIYTVATAFDSAANGDITVDVAKQVLTAGSTFTLDVGSAETVQKEIFQLLLADGSAGSIFAIQAKYYPSA